MSAPKPATIMVSVLDGERCLGFLLDRGKAGHEAFTVPTAAGALVGAQETAP
jgi:hypothetical protein